MGNYEPKLNHQEHAGFSPWFHLPGFHFEYPFLTHSQLGKPFLSFGLQPFLLIRLCVFPPPPLFSLPFCFSPPRVSMHIPLESSKQKGAIWVCRLFFLRVAVFSFNNQGHQKDSHHFGGALKIETSISARCVLSQLRRSKLQKHFPKNPWNPFRSVSLVSASTDAGGAKQTGKQIFRCFAWGVVGVVKSCKQKSEGEDCLGF